MVFTKSIYNLTISFKVGVLTLRKVTRKHLGTSYQEQAKSNGTEYCTVT
jgi:hypothetical protein